ncbi:hypothetical protein [Sphingobium sp. Z007]|nr:hypothetical protein [Sphingobium sp. Z007]
MPIAATIASAVKTTNAIVHNNVVTKMTGIIATCAVAIHVEERNSDIG